MKWFQHLRTALACTCLLSVGQAATAESHWQWSNPRPTGNFVLGLTWGNDEFIGVDDAGMVEKSLDGVQWRLLYSGALYTPEDIAWSGSQYVLVGWNGEIMTSPDGDTWTNQDSGTTEILWAVIWAGNQFVAVGGDFGHGLILT
ncbi:MAG TPA: hypothetical protein VLK83_03755, partial [Rhodanobacteraceae bacterium]|nr:hypothetical protein [Rhodanobacteraceae bacterium]